MPGVKELKDGIQQQIRWILVSVQVAHRIRLVSIQQSTSGQLLEPTICNILQLSLLDRRKKTKWRTGKICIFTSGALIESQEQRRLLQMELFALVTQFNHQLHWFRKTKHQHCELPFIRTIDNQGQKCMLICFCWQTTYHRCTVREHLRQDIL